MTWEKEQAFDLLRTKRERDQMRSARVLLPASFEGGPTREQEKQLVTLAGAWRGSWFAYLRERAFDLFRTREERKAALMPRVWLQGDVRVADEQSKKALSRLDEIYSEHAHDMIDLSEAMAKVRRDLGLPATGPVHGFAGVPDEVAEAIERVDKNGGKLPVDEVVKTMSLLNPEGSEAAVLAHRDRKATS